MKNPLVKLSCVLVVIMAVATGCVGSPPPMAEFLPVQKTLTPVGAENVVLNWVGASTMRWGVGLDTASMNIRKIAIDIDEKKLNDLCSSSYSCGTR